MVSAWSPPGLCCSCVAAMPVPWTLTQSGCEPLTQAGIHLVIRDLPGDDSTLGWRWLRSPDLLYSSCSGSVGLCLHPCGHRPGPASVLSSAPGSVSGRAALSRGPVCQDTKEAALTYRNACGNGSPELPPHPSGGAMLDVEWDARISQRDRSLQPCILLQLMIQGSQRGL